MALLLREVNINVTGPSATWRGQIITQLTAALVGEGDPHILKAVELYTTDVEDDPNDALLGSSTYTMGKDSQLTVNVTN